MESVLHDLRYFCRQALKNPGFTLTSVLSLALGIGATTVVFSVIYAALIHPYPYANANRIVRLTVETESSPVYWVSLNGPQIEQLRQLNILDSVLAMDYRPLVLTGREFPQNVNVIALTANSFRDLGILAALGRGLLPSDAAEGEEPQPVAVLAYEFWRARFLSNPNVLGKTLELDRRSYTIVGVAAPRFRWYDADVYLPLELTPDPHETYMVNVRLKPGVTFEEANSVFGPLLREFAKDVPNHFPEQFTVHVEGLNAWVTRSIGKTLYLLLGAVGLLLVIGCGNVSILLLARGTARRPDLAVRAALGASRARIVRHLLTESLLLSATGALLGVAASYGMLQAVRRLLPPDNLAPEVALGIHLPVLIFSVVVALGTGALFGLWPAWQLSRTNLGRTMQANSRRVAGSGSERRMHGALIAGQIALTLLLLGAAGSAVKGFAQLTHEPLGYDPHNVMAVGVPLHPGMFDTWAARAQYLEQLRVKAAEIPGVIVAAVSTNATPPENGWNLSFEISGKPAIEDQTASFNLVDPLYFSALRIPLLEGRLWTEAENREAAHVAVINRTLAKRFFGNGDAVGHLLRLPGIEERPPAVLSVPNIGSLWFEIIGVVGDARNNGLRNPVRPAVFVPYTLSLRQAIYLLVRTQVPPLTLLRAVQIELATVNPEQQTYSNVEDLESWISDEPEWEQGHVAAWIFGILAWLALALAAVGLYSVVSYTVAQRTNEFGIRMALGARPGNVMRLVFLSTLWSIAGGVLAGLALLLMLNTILGRWAGSAAGDPVIFLAGILLLSIVSLVACAIPARQAARVDPAKSLRFD